MPLFLLGWNGSQGDEGFLVAHSVPPLPDSKSTVSLSLMPPLLDLEINPFSIWK